MIPWHRLFGMTLTDFFTGTSFRVELEKDLSLKQQFLDVVIIEKEEGSAPEEIPDGLENMGLHNLMTYKSHQQPLDAWTLDEFTGHYVNYRKLISPFPDRLLPPENFRLYAVCTRYPAGLGEYTELKKLKDGVYDARWGGSIIRIIVLGRIPERKNNAMWNLFSAVPEKVVSGASGYRWKSPVSTVMNELFTKYRIEGVIAMPYTIEDFQRDYAREYLDRLSADEVLSRFSPDEILKRYSSDEVLKRYSPDEVLKRYSPDEVLKRYSSDEVLKRYSSDEVLKKFSPEDRLKGISPDERLKGISDRELRELIRKRFSKSEREEILKMLEDSEQDR